MEDYNALYNRFKWNIPIHFNIGVATCDVHAENSPDSIALICEDDNGKTVKYSFHKIKNLSNKFANLYCFRLQLLLLALSGQILYYICQKLYLGSKEKKGEL